LAIGAGISLLATAALGAVGAPASAQEPVTLTIWSPENRPDDAAAHAWLIEQFKAANPDINVELSTTAWDDHFAEIDAAAAAPDNMPDIVYTWQPNTAALMDKGLLADMTDVWDSVGPDNLPAGEREVLTKDGKLYAIPFIGYPHALWYRSDWFSEAGLEAPQTWDDILAAARALTDDERKGICLFGKGLDAYYVTDHMLAAGAQAFDETGAVAIDSPETVKVLEFIKAVNDEGLTPEGWMAMNMDDAKLPFIAGKCAMKIDSASFLGTLATDNPDLLPNVGVAPIPLDGGQFAGWAGASAYGVTEASAHQAEAKKFLEFMFQPEIYSGFIGRQVLGFQPELKPVADDPAFYEQERIAPLADIYRGAAAAAAGGYPGATYAAPGTADLNAQVYNQQVYSDMAARIEQGQTPEEVAAWAATRIAEIAGAGA
jgi:multiple sugar transport system substrate-binding protein